MKGVYDTPQRFWGENREKYGVVGMVTGVTIKKHAVNRGTATTCIDINTSETYYLVLGDMWNTSSPPAFSSSKVI